MAGWYPWENGPFLERNRGGVDGVGDEEWMGKGWRGEEGGQLLEGNKLNKNKQNKAQNGTE